MDERSTHYSATVAIEQISNISHISGMLAIGGDVVAGNKTVIQNIIQQSIIQQVAKKIVSHPYKFLFSYDILDKDIFYGRGALTAEIAGKVPRHRVLLINGASGSGKSSLINAGLIPLLAENGYTYVSFRYYDNPLQQLRDYLVKTAIFPTAGLEIELLMQIVQGFQRQQLQVVFIFDQFERFFVNVPLSARSQFIGMIKICMDSLQTDEMNVIFSMREEFFGRFQGEFEKVMPGFLDECPRFNIDPLSPSEARLAIMKPLLSIEAKIVYDDDFVDKILLTGLVEDTGESKGINPPHLQIVCNQLYQLAYKKWEESKDSAVINAKLYEQLGGTQTILRTYLDDRVKTVANNDLNLIKLLHSLLKQMIETAGTRKFVTAQQLHLHLSDVEPSQINDFLTKLQDERVIEMRRQEASYSLSHEFMVAKVKDWFDEREMARKRAEEALERGLSEWKNSEDLLNEKQIKQIRTAQIVLNAEEEEFLRASETECDKQRRKEEEQIRIMNYQRKIIQLGFVTIVIAILVISYRELKQADLELKQAGIELKQADKRLQETQKKNSSELAKVSRQTLEKGIVIKAMSLALDALPKNMDAPEREYDPEAVKSLRNAFYHSRIERILKHEDILGVEFVPDGQKAVTASKDTIQSVKFSRDGQKVVTALGNTAKIWNVTGEPIAILKHEEKVSYVEFSPDGQKVVTASRDKTARIWKMTGEPVATLKHEEKVYYAKFSPDGQKVVTVSANQQEEIVSGNQKVVTVSGKQTAKMWKVTGELVTTLTLPHEEQVRYAEFSPDSQRVVTASWDNTAKIWNVTGELIATLEHKEQVISAKFSPDGQKIVTVSGDKTAKIWNVTGEHDRVVTLEHEGGVRSAEFSPDGQKVVTASWDNTAKIWKVTGELIIPLKHEDGVSSAEFSPDGQKVVTASLDNTAKIWKVTGEPIATLKHERSVLSAEFSPDGQRVVTASDNIAIILNVANLMREPFNSTQELINAARELVDRELAKSDNK